MFGIYQSSGKTCLLGDEINKIEVFGSTGEASFLTETIFPSHKNGFELADLARLWSYLCDCLGEVNSQYKFSYIEFTCRARYEVSIRP